ncbi:TIGR00341 family protein [Natronorubrum sp. JWXQ-INN-674]|uniref:TIGR00341 family protein n=1 Tax=Natronorubrum halalkaliphilum TaxID=2691917 RepID=A0A6B0VKJ1_9EURY|nr:TIGR00341 family protein [Natronorubrum halalkaliphilum]MXV61526.1 TIGR00341 family protein [Natronorubrum halalkaliphilum]
MRHIQVTIPIGKRETILDLLDDEGIDYVVTDESSSREYDAVVSFPVPTNAVEPVLDSLQDAGVDEESYTVVVDAETVISRKFEQLQNEHATESVEEEQISRQELLTRADELTPTFSVFFVMTLISAVVATVGLLLDSPAVVVGSMVIAPLIGPALSASIGTVTNDREVFLTGMKYQFTGVFGGIIAAAVFAWIFQALFLVPPGAEITELDEVAERIAPELLLLPVALGAGAAGILSLATGFSIAIVGVMIAAALVPPMAAAGVALAYGLPVAALGSTVLVLVNLLGVNLAGLLTLRYLGYRPGSWFEISTAQRQFFKQVAVLVGVIFLLSLFLTGVTYSSYQMSAFEQTTDEQAEDVLNDHEDLILLGTEVEVREEGLPFDASFDATGQIDLVIVEIGGPPGSYDPEIVAAIDERINQETTGDTDVQVRFVTTGGAEDTPATAPGADDDT